MFNKERKEKQLLKRWVEEIAGDDEEFEVIIKHMSKHANLMSFDKFKKMCEDDNLRADFVKKCAKPIKDIPQLDEE